MVHVESGPSTTYVKVRETGGNTFGLPPGISEPERNVIVEQPHSGWNPDRTMNNKTKFEGIPFKLGVVVANCKSEVTTTWLKGVKIDTTVFLPKSLQKKKQQRSVRWLMHRMSDYTTRTGKLSVYWSWRRRPASDGGHWRKVERCDFLGRKVPVLPDSKSSSPILPSSQREKAVEMEKEQTTVWTEAFLTRNMSEEAHLSEHIEKEVKIRNLSLLDLY